MNWKIISQRKWLKLISTIILIAGMVSSTLIYQRAGDDAYRASAYEDSKMYRHDLEVYGGKFSVIMDDCTRWFFGLWHGKSLAFIIAGTTLIISFGFFYAAQHWSQDLKPDAHKNDS
jgi:hypothetical protein